MIYSLRQFQKSPVGGFWGVVLFRILHDALVGHLLSDGTM
jgi:hypothetical protein